MHLVHIHYKSVLYEQALELRQKVLREPLGLNIRDEDLTNEIYCLHYGLLHQEELIAYLLMQPLEPSRMKLRQMAVSKYFRAQGVGRRLILSVEKEVFARGVMRIELHARSSALDFYRKLGYTVEGEPFDEVGIAHRKMFKEKQG